MHTHTHIYIYTYHEITYILWQLAATKQGLCSLWLEMNHVYFSDLFVFAVAPGLRNCLMTEIFVMLRRPFKMTGRM